MKVSQLIMKLLKVDADLDVYIQASRPESDDADGIIEPADILEVVSVKMPNGEWKKIQVNLRADSDDEESE